MWNHYHIAMRRYQLTRQNYRPAELRTRFLVAFCIVTLVICALVQIAIAAFMGAPGLHSLVQRSVELPSPPASTASGRPGPGSYSGTGPVSSTSSPDTTSMPTPTPHEVGAPSPGSFSTVTATGWGQSYYFIGGYLPTLVAVLLSIWWKCIFSKIKEMEPLYQMNTPQGAKAQDSILLTYSGTFLPKVLWRSYGAHHWPSFLGAVNMILTTICTLFASETLFLTGVGPSCGVILNSHADVNEGCRIALGMRPALGWALGVVLIAAVLVTVCLIRRLHSQSSRVRADPSTIAGIACLYGDELSKDFPQVLANPSARYRLNSLSEIETVVGNSNPTVTGQPQSSPRSKYGHAAMHPAALAFYGSSLVGVLVLIVYYAFISTPEQGGRLEDFMNSQSFGVRLLMTAMGLLIKTYWGWVESYMRSVHPYVTLVSKHGATAAESVLMRTPGHPIPALYHTATWKNMFLASVTVMAVLSEVLVITLGGIPFSTATAYLAFEISVYISLGILSGMLVVLLGVLVWTTTRKYTSQSPDIPENISDVLQLLGDEIGREALKELNGTEEFGSNVEHMRFALRQKPETKKWFIIKLNHDALLV
ncbi:hypothetical protein FB567DRAFT_513705 [Paraphoma chrysanthemicola]|uniref:Transmembrane protein n=1 Tax=Paraphoma chrysanthemicola TaxID=798071 RepID=A0A8K0RM69_9PLEO|nr:hypothetical protein FB567DRAFT_513705 [Paraphoma chrysanthemicola]